MAARKAITSTREQLEELRAKLIESGHQHLTQAVELERQDEIIKEFERRVSVIEEPPRVFSKWPIYACIVILTLVYIVAVNNHEKRLKAVEGNQASIQVAEASLPSVYCVDKDGIATPSSGGHCQGTRNSAGEVISPYPVFGVHEFRVELPRDCWVETVLDGKTTPNLYQR